MLINNSWNLKWLQKQILELNISRESLSPEPFSASVGFALEEGTARSWYFQGNCVF